MDLQEVGCRVVDLNEMAQDSDRWGHIDYSTGNSDSTNAENFLTS